MLKSESSAARISSLFAILCIIVTAYFNLNVLNHLYLINYLTYAHSSLCIKLSLSLLILLNSLLFL